MRKGLLTILSFISVLGLGLVSCNNNNSENTSIDSTSSVEDGNVMASVVDPESREYVEVGTVIDLNDWVTLYKSGRQDPQKGTDDNFKATLITPDTAELDGHKLTVTSEGQITVTISNLAGKNLASLTVNSASSTKIKFSEFVKNLSVTNEYYAFNTKLDGNSLLIEDGALVMDEYPTIHNPNYFALYDSDENEYWGLMRAGDGLTYNFTMADRKGTNLNVKQGPTGTDFSYYYIAMNFPVSGADFTTEVSSEGTEYLTLNSSRVSDFLIIVLGYSYDNILAIKDETTGKALYKDVEVDVEYYPVKYVNDNNQEVVEELPVVSSYAIGNDENSTKYLIAMNALSYGSENFVTTSAGVESYLKDNKYPEPIKDPGINTALDKIKEGKNYTETLTTGWYDRVSDSTTGGYKYTALAEAPKAEAGYVNSITEYKLGTSKLSTAKSEVTSDRVKLTFDENFFGQEGTVDIKASSTNGKYDVTTNIGTKTVEGQGEVLGIVDSTTTSVDGASGATDTYTAFVDNTINGVRFDGADQGKYISSVDTTESDKGTTTTVSVSGKYVPDFFTNLASSSPVAYFGNEILDFDKWSVSLNGSSDTFASYLDFTISYTQKDGKYVDFKVDAEITWGESTTTAGAYTVYRMIFDFTNIGTTSIK